MSFEMKYDRDGKPLVSKEEQTLQQTAAESIVEDQPDVEASEVESSPVIEDTKPELVKQTAPQESWKILREKAEKAERERDEAIRYAKEVEARSKNDTKEVEEDLSFNVEEDALVEGKHLSKVNKQIRKLEAQLKQYQQQTSLSATEVKLKSQYPDFDKVVSAENLSNLRAAYPEIANTINSATDIYDKAVSAYTMIKRLGIAPEDTFQADKAVAQKNAAKPRPLASVSPQQGDSPLSHANAFANGLTDDLKSQLRKEMENARRGY